MAKTRKPPLEKVGSGTYTPRVERWRRFECVVPHPQESAKEHSTNPSFAFQVSFRHRTSGEETVVDGFPDFEGSLRARFSPSLEGAWDFEFRSPQENLNGLNGSFACTPASPSNHGPVLAQGHHFEFADGTPFTPWGTTAYGWIHNDLKLYEETLDTIIRSPFNKLRMLLFPKYYRYTLQPPERCPYPSSPDNQETSEFDTTTFDSEFFRLLEDALERLEDAGVQVDLVLFHPYDRWGFSRQTREADEALLRYLVARLSAFSNLWWALTNEWELVKGKDAADWDHLGVYLAANDPHQRLRSIHHSIRWFDQTRPWITHLSLQTHALKPREWRIDYAKPTIVDELGYEGVLPVEWGNLTGLELIHRTWVLITQGAFPGHSETIPCKGNQMWWNMGGHLKGESAARFRFLRDLLESGPDKPMVPWKCDDWPHSVGAKGENWILGYLGRAQSTTVEVWLPPEVTAFRLFAIDPWMMEIRDTNQEFRGTGERQAIPMSGAPYQAFLLKRAD